MSKVKRHKPRTPGQRGMRTTDYSVLDKKAPEKRLTSHVHSNKGRNKGRISTRHRGGGFKRLYRNIDFKQNRTGEELKILSLEYDPNRTAFIALAQNQYGEKKYLLASEGVSKGQVLKVAEKTSIKRGNRMKLKNILLGTEVHNVEIKPGRGGQLARSAGASVKILAHDAGYTQLTMPSGEIRLVPSEGFATVGRVSHSSHSEEVISKAGKQRLRGKRPHVRGSAMNPVDHPHGGGEGRTPIGLKYPKTPWGKNAYGVKTRKRKKYSDRLIIKRRSKRKKRR